MLLFHIFFTSNSKSDFLWITTNCGKFWTRWDYQTTWPASWEICMQVKKQQLEPDMERSSMERTWFQIGKAVQQGCILSPCLFNLYSEYIRWNAGLDEAKAAIKISGRNINNFRYADDTTLMAESKQELTNVLMKVKDESEKVYLKLNSQKTKTIASGPITSWQIDRETMETVTGFIDLRQSWAPKSLQMVTSSMKLKDTCSWEEKRWPI